MSASEYKALLKLNLDLYPPESFEPFSPTSKLGSILSASRPLYFSTS